MPICYLPSGQQNSRKTSSLSSQWQRHAGFTKLLPSKESESKKRWELSRDHCRLQMTVHKRKSVTNKTKTCNRQLCHWFFQNLIPHFPSIFVVFFSALFSLLKWARNNTPLVLLCSCKEQKLHLIKQPVTVWHVDLDCQFVRPRLFPGFLRLTFCRRVV